MNEDGPSRRHRRDNLHLAASADEVLVYTIYQGDELLLHRRGTADVIAGVRKAFEPLPLGLRATLGSGDAKDPVVAEGTHARDETPEERLARAGLEQAKQIAAMARDLAKANFELVAFSRTALAESGAQIFAARAEASAEVEKRYQELFARLQGQQKQPLISEAAVTQLGGLLNTVMSFLDNKGAKNG